jgi:GTP cyclohydrolase I
LPITGKAHVSYISSGKVIGLSKLNRIVQYYSHRPQVQERLTKQIYDELKNILDTDSVMIVIEAKHMCVSSRGIKDYTSSTVTEMYGGDFNIYNKRDEFYKLLNSVNI